MNCHSYSAWSIHACMYERTTIANTLYILHWQEHIIIIIIVSYKLDERYPDTTSRHISGYRATHATTTTQKDERDTQGRGRASSIHTREFSIAFPSSVCEDGRWVHREHQSHGERTAKTLLFQSPSHWPRTRLFERQRFWQKYHHGVMLESPMPRASGARLRTMEYEPGKITNEKYTHIQRPSIQLYIYIDDARKRKAIETHDMRVQW